MPKKLNAFATFAVTSTPQLCVLKKHNTKCEFHSRAVSFAAAQASGATSSVCRLSSVELKGDLWVGAVPQPADWVHAWGHARHKLSSRCAQFGEDLRAFCHSPKRVSPTHQFLVKSVFCQAEVIRMKQSWLALQNAASITLRWDGEGSQVIMSYVSCSRTMQRSEGLIGVMNDFGEKCVAELTPESARRPKTDKYVDGTKEIFKLFCTENVFNRKTDVGRFKGALHDHIVSAVTGLVPDGEAAMQKAERLLSRRFFLNNLICGWDEVHNLRAILQGAARADDMYKKIKWQCWQKAVLAKARSFW